MSSYVWAKVFIEVLEDPKMGRLPDNLWRRVIELILLAKQHNKGGFLPGPVDMSWSLRIAIEQLEADLENISKIGTDYDPPRPILEIRDGKWFLTNYKKRQDAEQVKERVANYRKRNVTQSGNDSVTNRYTEEEVDIEKEKKLESSGAPAPATTSPRNQLRFDMTPQGALMAQKLRVVYESKGRRPPEFYGNALQRDAYLIAFSALGDNLGRLLDRAMQKEIIERGKLLDWLNGCVRNGNGNGRRASDQNDKLSQATALTLKRLKQNGDG